MHEQAIARALLAQVLRIAEDSGARSVQSVRVCVGHFSGVEELLLASAFELATIDTIAASAQLEVESVPLALHCQECDHHFQPAALRFQCAACGSARVRITAGEELVLESVNLMIADAGGPMLPPVADDCPRITDRGIPCDEPLRCP